ncbi:MAG: hypothetical protein L3J21_12060, partial [Devosiaceae bacterium]|nr:hypothetical protein [Devosiaceae bacterium]
MTITPFNWLGENLVNTQTSLNQLNSEVAVLANGNYVVTWQDYSGIGDDNSESGIKAQLYSATGEPLGNEFLVNTVITDSQTFPTITALANGGFVISYQSFATGSGDIYAQIYSADAVAVGTELILNSVTAGIQNFSNIVALDNGGFITTWRDASDFATTGFNIQVRRFDADGTAADASDILVTSTIGDQTNPEVATLAGGAFVVVWEDLNDTGTSRDIKMQLFNAAGTMVGGEQVVNSTLPGLQTLPSVTTLDNGNFVVAWQGSGVFARIFDASGVEVVAEFQVASLNGGPGSAEVISLRDGGFVVTWKQGQSGVADEIMLQRYDASGATVGTTIIVNTIDADNQRSPDFDVTDDGRLIMVWDDFSQSPDDNNEGAIRSQILSLTADNSFGTAGVDSLLGNANANVIHGLAGDDQIDGQGGNDIINGGAGMDDIYG